MVWLPLKFAQAVLRYWGSLLTSGVLIGVLGIWQSTGHGVPPAVYWTIAIAGFLISAYRAWEVEYQQRAKLQVEVEAHKRWEFQAEFVGASRSVYTYKNGDSPQVSIWIRARVHNRNPEPTTVFPRKISVKINDTVDTSFQRATIFPGGQFNFENPEEYAQYDLASSATTDLCFYSKRYNPPQIQEYIRNIPLQVTLELGETYGKLCEVTGPMKLDGVNEY